MVWVIMRRRGVSSERRRSSCSSSHWQQRNIKAQCYCPLCEELHQWPELWIPCTKRQLCYNFICNYIFLVCPVVKAWSVAAGHQGCFLYRVLFLSTRNYVRPILFKYEDFRFIAGTRWEKYNWQNYLAPLFSEISPMEHCNCRDSPTPRLCVIDAFKIPKPHRCHKCCGPWAHCQNCQKSYNLHGRHC